MRIAIIFLTLLLSQLSSCKWKPGQELLFSFASIKVPNGTPAFQSGYKDGCSSVLYARGNIFYRTRFDYRYDPTMASNKEYKSGYSRGWGYCFGQVVGVSPTARPTTSPDRLLAPYGLSPTFDMGPNSVNNAWGGFFGSRLSAPIDVNYDATPGGLDASFSILQNGISGGVAGDGQTAFGNPFWTGKTSVGFMGIW
jgi:hypothetical protein